MKNKPQITRSCLPAGRPALVGLIFVGLVSGLFSCLGHSPKSPFPPPVSCPVIPQPRMVERKETPLVYLSPDWALLLESTANDFDRFSAGQLQSDLKGIYGLDIPIISDDAMIKTRDKVIILGVFDRDTHFTKRCISKGVFIQKWLGNEGYVLDIEPNRVFVLGQTSTGVFYAVQTLRQLLSKEGDEIKLPSLNIRDTPTFRWRGYQMDISHLPIPKMEYFKEIIRRLSFYKYNLLTLYTEPQCIKFRNYPKLGNPSALTGEEITELVQYGRLHQMALVGNFQSLAHWEKVLTTVDTDVSADAKNLSPLKEKTYTVLSDLYDELVSLYPSEFFHLNLDEGESEVNPDQWLAHLRHLHNIMLSHQKRIMLWSDVPLKYERLISELPPDIIIMNRSGDDYRKVIRIFKERGLTQFICPSTGGTNQVFPQLDQVSQDIYQSLKTAADEKIDGMLLVGSLQGKGEDWLETEWYPLTFASECAWQIDRVDEDRFRQKFTNSFYGRNTDEALRIMEYLNTPSKLLAQPPDLTEIFWSDPFASRIHLTIPDFYQRLDTIEKSTRDTRKLITELSTQSHRHQDNLEYLSFTARRWAVLANKFRLAREIMTKYQTTSTQWRDVHHQSLLKIDEISPLLEKLRQDLSGLKDEYQRLYDQTYRSHEVKEDILKRFAELDNIYQSKEFLLREVREKLTMRQAMPEPAVLDFHEKKPPERTIHPTVMIPPFEITKIPRWWNETWHYRTVVRLINSDIPRTEYPVEITVNFSELLKERGVAEEWDKNSIRVIEETNDGKLVEIPYQFDPAPNFNTKYNADGRLVWVIAGEWPPQQTRSYNVYFDTVNNGVKKSTDYQVRGLKTYDGKNGAKWVENERMKVELNPREARLTQWFVKDGNIQIIKSGPPASTNKLFDLKLESAGPILVRYRTTNPTGINRTINFFHNLPLVEVILSTATSEVIHYDNLPEGRNPGNYLFSNSLTGRLPPEKTHPIQEKDINWSAKVSRHNLVVSCLTPDDKATHSVGWNSFGVTTNRAPLFHFIIFADRLPDSARLVLPGENKVWYLLNQVCHTYRLTAPPKIQRFPVEVKIP